MVKAKGFIRLFSLFSVVVLGAVAAFADAGYFTTYTHHMVPGELEIMLMSDYTRPSTHKQTVDGQQNYFSQMLELEYVPTSQLALELMIEGYQEPGTGDRQFTGARYETRYRLFKDIVTFNPVLYFEYEDLDARTRYKMETSGWIDPPYAETGVAPARESILESRLVLSQDFGSQNAWNVAFNWINESDLSAGQTAFGYATGLLYRLPQAAASGQEELHSHHAGHHMPEPKPGGRAFIRPMLLAFELLGGLGDTKSFGLHPARQEHYFQPSAMFHVGELMLNLGAAIGLTPVSDNMIRLSLGSELAI